MILYLIIAPTLLKPEVWHELIRIVKIKCFKWFNVLHKDVDIEAVACVHNLQYKFSTSSVQVNSQPKTTDKQPRRLYRIESSCCSSQVNNWVQHYWAQQQLTYAQRSQIPNCFSRWYIYITLCYVYMFSFRNMANVKQKLASLANSSGPSQKDRIEKYDVFTANSIMLLLLILLVWCHLLGGIFLSWRCYSLSTDLRYRSIALRHRGICCWRNHRWIALRYRWMSTDQCFQVSWLGERSFWALGFVNVVKY